MNGQTPTGSEPPVSVARIFKDTSLFQIKSFPKSRMKLPPLDQIGFVVKDMDKAIDFYGSVFGWGPWYVREVEATPIFRGKPSKCRMKLGFASSGPVEIELIQIMEGESLHTEFLRDRGEGLHHLRFQVDDLNHWLAELAKDGIEPIWRGPRVAYLNSDSIGGVILELVAIK